MVKPRKMINIETEKRSKICTCLNIDEDTFNKLLLVPTVSWLEHEKVLSVPEIRTERKNVAE